MPNPEIQTHTLHDCTKLRTNFEILFKEYWDSIPARPYRVGPASPRWLHHDELIKLPGVAGGRFSRFSSKIRKIDGSETPEIAKTQKERVENAWKVRRKSAKARKSSRNAKWTQKRAAEIAKTQKERPKSGSESENSAKITKTHKERSKKVSFYLFMA